MRRLLTAALGLMLLALAGCSGDADPAPAPARPSSTTASPSPSPSPTAPAMPDAARAHTEAGAKAFVEYFWEVVNYAANSGDTAVIRALSIPGCKGCEGGVGAIDRIYKAGGTLTGGAATTSNLHAEVARDAATHVIATVTVELDFKPEVIDYPGTSRDARHPSSDARDRLQLLHDGQEWKVAQLEVLP